MVQRRTTNRRQPRLDLLQLASNNLRLSRRRAPSRRSDSKNKRSDKSGVDQRFSFANNSPVLASDSDVNPIQMSNVPMNIDNSRLGERDGPQSQGHQGSRHDNRAPESTSATSVPQTQPTRVRQDTSNGVDVSYVTSNSSSSSPRHGHQTITNSNSNISSGVSTTTPYSGGASLSQS